VHACFAAESGQYCFEVCGIDWLAGFLSDVCEYGYVVLVFVADLSAGEFCCDVFGQFCADVVCLIALLECDVVRSFCEHVVEFLLES